MSMVALLRQSPLKRIVFFSMEIHFFSEYIVQTLDLIAVVRSKIIHAPIA